MTRRTRRTIFYVLFILFFVIGGAVVFYAEGWRVDPATFHIRKVGAVFVRSFPENASITLDGKPIPNQSNFLSHGTLISDLFSKTYTLGLSLSGYDAWQENAEVLPSLVTTFKYAVLVPQTSAAVATTSDLRNFFVIGNDHVDQHSDENITWRNLTIGHGTIVSHSTDLKTMVFKNPAGNYVSYDFTTQKTTNLTALLQQGGANVRTIQTVLVDPQNDTSAIVATKNRLWTVDLAAQTAKAIAVASSGDVLAFPIASSQSLLAWSELQPTSGTSEIFLYDKFAGSMLGDPLVLSGATANLAWIDGDTLGVLQGNGVLYRYTVSSRQAQVQADDVKNFYATPDGTMLAALENHSVEVFDFPTGDYYRFNLPEMASVQSLIWYKDEAHLFAEYPDHISFLDLEDASLSNFTTVSPGTAPLYDTQQNALYLASPAGDLVRFDFPS